MDKKKLKYPLFLLSLLLIVLFNVPSYAKEKDDSKISVVVIDPGHGGKDPGAQIGNTREKDIVLNIALKLGKAIQQHHPDVRVIYTRTKDVFIPLHKRADIANKNDADLFLSIHVNAVDARSVSGTETFVLGLHRNEENLAVAQKENAVIQLEENYEASYEDFDPNSDVSYIMFANVQQAFQEQSVLMASYIQDEFRNHAKRPDRSVKMAGFLVLRETTMPSVLIETGFLSHSHERNYLSSSWGQEALAESICRAFTLYRTEIEERSSFSLVSEDVAVVPMERETNSTTAAVPEKVLPARTTQNQDQIASPEAKLVPDKPDLFFSVQIMALSRKLEPTPENFKQERNIFRRDNEHLYRYFSGKFENLSNAEKERKRLEKNYPNAFVVAFENNQLISLKKALENR